MTFEPRIGGATEAEHGTVARIVDATGNVGDVQYRPNYTTGLFDAVTNQTGYSATAYPKAYVRDNYARLFAAKVFLAEGYRWLFPVPCLAADPVVESVEFTSLYDALYEFHLVLVPTQLGNENPDNDRSVRFTADPTVPPYGGIIEQLINGRWERLAPEEFFARDQQSDEFLGLPRARPVLNMLHSTANKKLDRTLLGLSDTARRDVPGRFSAAQLRMAEYTLLMASLQLNFDQGNYEAVKETMKRLRDANRRY